VEGGGGGGEGEARALHVQWVERSVVLFDSEVNQDVATVKRTSTTTHTLQRVNDSAVLQSQTNPVLYNAGPSVSYLFVCFTKL